MNLWDFRTNYKILVVEDNPFQLQVLASYLHNANYRTVLAKSGKEAYEAINKQLPDLILLDLMLPDTDGFAVCDNLKNQDHTKNIPIIFLTAMEDTDNIVKCFQIGGADYVSKPYKERELLARIDVQLELKHFIERIKYQNEMLHKEINLREKAENEILRLNQTLEERVGERTKQLEDTTKALFMEIMEKKQAEEELKDSEDKFRSFIDQSADGMMLVNAVGNIIEWNKALVKITGLSKETAMRMKFWEVEAKLSLTDNVETGRKEFIEMTQNNYSAVFFIRKDTEIKSISGEEKTIQIAIFPVLTNQENLIGFIIRDITEHKIAERKITHRLSMEEIVSNISTHFLKTPAYDFENEVQRDLNIIGEFTQVQRSALNLLSEDKTTIEEHIEWNSIGLRENTIPIKGEKIEKFEWIDEQLKSLSHIYIADVEELPDEAKYEKEVWLNIGINSVLIIPLAINFEIMGFLGFYCVEKYKKWTDEDFNLLKVVGNIFINALERKFSEESIHKQTNQLKELNATKDKFFSIISHDLKNPLNDLKEINEALIMEFDNLEKSDIKPFLSSIKTTAENIANLLQNLSEWSKIQTGKIQINREDNHLDLIVGNIISLLKISSNKKKITINSLISENTVVNCDLNMIHTIIRNLAANAIKFSYEDSEIKIDCYEDSDNFYVSVEDEGVGIPKEAMNKLFKTDETVSTLGTNQEKGTGLGLILCKEFVDLHNGNIWVEPKITNGSKFVFSINKK